MLRTEQFSVRILWEVVLQLYPSPRTSTVVLLWLTLKSAFIGHIFLSLLFLFFVTESKAKVDGQGEIENLKGNTIT